MPNFGPVGLRSVPSEALDSKDSDGTVTGS